MAHEASNCGCQFYHMSWAFYIKVQWCNILIASQIEANSVFHEHKKHVGVYCQFILEVENREIRLEYVHTDKQLVDFLTMVVSRRQLLSLLAKLCIVDIYVRVFCKLQNYNKKFTCT